jgi:hypothetical protein
MFKKKIVFIILFSLNAFSQKNDDFYINQTGFSKISILSKKDTISFLTSSQEVKKPKPTILFLQGSLPLPIIFKDSIGASGTILPFSIDNYLAKFNFILIPRYGIPLIGSYEKDTNGFLDTNGKTPFEYTKNNNLKYRTFQAKTVIDYLYKQKWVQKDSIFVIGHSEGYRVAAKLSENNKKIAKVVCMSANPFNRIAEYIMKSRIETLSTVSDSLIQKEIDNDVEAFKNISDNIEEYRGNIELYNRMSYNSVLSYESLLKFPNPILVTYGTEDFGSLHNDLLPFLLRKKKLTMIVYPDLGHNYEKKEFDKKGNSIESSYHWDTVFRDIQNWLLK